MNADSHGLFHGNQKVAEIFAYFAVVALLGGLALAAEPTATNDWVLRIRGGSDSSPAIGSDGTIYLGARIGRLWAVPLGVLWAH